MISTWRAVRRTRRKDQPGNKKASGKPILEVSIPTHFRCPVTLDVMKDPVTLSTGITYDRQSIEAWLDAGNCTCPVTNQVLKNTDQIPNHALRRMIQDWCVENRSFGIERIPTPRIPITVGDVSETLFEITATTRSRDDVRCRELVHRIKIWGKESDRNKKCIIASGTGRVVSAAFRDFAAASTENCYVGVMEEILSLLTWMLPLDVEARSNLGSHASLVGMVWFLKCGNLVARRSAVLALRELVSSDQLHVVVLAEIDGLIEALVKLIKEPICPTTTKASLVTIFYLVSSSPTSLSAKTATRFVEMDLVSFLLEIILDSDKSVCEKALAVLDGICDHPIGREKAYEHALTMPILVKKVFRVSNMATEFVVSVLWKLCKNYKREEGEFLVEGLQVGAFQKLLLLLQVGCDDRTKEKATDLLKLLNGYRSRLECIDSVDFKELKRPF